MKHDKPVHRFDKFEYHTEDLNCSCCLHRENKECDKKTCRYADIRQQAVENNRTKRKRGWFKNELD